MALMGCGAPASTADRQESPATFAEVSTIRSTQAQDLLGADWEPSVRGAKYPIFVAYGLPDDPSSAAILYFSFQRKLARCLVSNGYTFFQPEPLGDQASSDANTKALNAMDIDKRQAFVAIEAECAEAANSDTFLLAALGFNDGSNQPGGADGGQTIDLTEEQVRQQEVELILNNRETIAVLVSKLEVD